MNGRLCDGKDAGTMNVLFAADYSTPKSGNFIASLLELANALREKGGTAVFLFKQADPNRSPWLLWLRRSGYPVIALEESKPVLEQFLSIVKQFQIDVIHTHFSLHSGLLTRNAKAFPHTRIIIHDHMAFPVAKRLYCLKLRLLYMSLYFRMKGVYVISASKKKNAYYFFCRHWFVPNGLSLLRDTGPDAAGAAAVPNFWNEPRKEGEKRCLFLGWHPKWKGLDVAIRAVELVRRRGIDLVLCVIGFGTGISQQNRDFLESATGIPVDAPFIKYLQSEEDMFAVHRSMDVYLSASRSEAFSYGLLEAISQNVPVVVSDIPGTKWSSQYNKSYFYPVESPEACADALVKALSQRESPSNCEDVVAAYSIDKWVSSVLRIYEIGKK